MPVPVKTASRSPSLSKSIKSTVPSLTATRLLFVFVNLKVPPNDVSFVYM